MAENTQETDFVDDDPITKALKNFSATGNIHGETKGSPSQKQGNSFDPKKGVSFVDAPEKKNVVSQPVAQSGSSSSQGGSGAFQNSLPLTQNNSLQYSFANPELKQQLINQDNAIRDKKIADEQDISNRLKTVYNGLDDESKQGWNTAMKAAASTPSDILSSPTKEELAHEQFMNTPAGKMLGAVAYVGSGATKGTLQVLKGASWLANRMNGNPALTAQMDSSADNFFNKADEVANYGLTAKDKQNIENESLGVNGKKIPIGKLTNGLGSLAEILPAAATGEASAATFALQGFGQGKEAIDKAEKASGVSVDPMVKDAFILGTGGAMAALMKIPIFNKLPNSLRSDIVASISSEAIKNASGKELTGEAFKELLDDGVKKFEDKVAKFGVNALQGYNKAAVDLSALQGANFALKKGVDVVSEHPVFNENLGQLAEGIQNTLTTQAPLFAGIGQVGELGKLFPNSGYKNTVAESLMADPSNENLIKNKEALAEVGRQRGWSPEETDATLKQIDNIHSIAKSLPRNISHDKVANAVDLVQGRNELQSQLDDLQKQRSGLDEAIKDIPSKEEALLQDKIDQANDKLRSLATGKPIYYGKERNEKTGEETGKYYKLMDGKKEEISESRYDLENLERDAKKQSNEETPQNVSANQPLPETAKVPTEAEPVANQENDIKEPQPINQNEPTTQSTETSAELQGQSEQPISAEANSPAATETPIEEVNSDASELSTKDAIRKSIEEETNPKKIAAQYHNENSYPDPIEKGIIDYLGNGKINEKDYERITGQKAPSGISRWIDTKNSDKTDINTHAEIISHELGVHVTPEDIVETIDRYTGRKNFQEANKSDVQRLLEDRYKELTGKTLTPRRAERAHGYVSKELTDAQVEAFNKSAKDIGITDEDVNNYERARKEQDRADKRRNAESVKAKVQQSKNEQGGREEKSSGDKSSQRDIETKAGDPIRSFAEKVRQGKINKLGGFKASTGFDGVWDASLEVVAKSLEGTAKVADAIEAGLKYVKSTEWYKDLTNKDEFDKQYREHLNNEYAEHEKTLPVKNEANEKIAAEHNIELKDTKNGVRSSEIIDADAKQAIKDGFDTHGLIDKILNDGHQASDTEQAILAKYRDLKDTEIKAQNKEIAERGATMSKREFASLMEANNQSLLDLQDVAQAIKKTGTASARALGARRFTFDKEVSLSNMIVQKRQALGNEKLTSEQLADVLKIHSELEETQKQLEARLKKVEDENAKLKASQNVKQVVERRTRRAVTKADLAAERSKIFEDIRKEFADIRKSGTAMSDIPYRRELAAVAKHMPQLLRNLAEDGIVRIQDVVDNLHDYLKDDLPELTKRDITDLIAGNYSEPTPTKQGLQDDIRSLKMQAKLINQIEDLENGIQKAQKAKRPVAKQTQEVQELRDRLKELTQRMRDAEKEPELIKQERDLADMKKRIQSNIDKLTERLNKGDFKRPESSKPVEKDAEALELQRKYDRIKREFDLGVARDALAQRTKIEKAKDNLLNIATLPRALKASLDFSAVLRQGLFLAPHLKESGKALKEMFGQTFSQEKYDNWLSDLKHSDMYDLMKDSELYLSDRSSPEILAREEEFTSNLADKVPFIGGDITIKGKKIPGLIQSSERAYTAYLNVLRAGVFTSEAQKLIERGYTFENNPKEFKSLAKVVNVLSGRGDIPEFLGGKQPKILSNALFSPRFMAARIQTLYLWADPRLSRNARVLAAKDIGAVLGSGITILSLAAAAGYNVNFNPTSTNFLRIQDKQEHGSTFYDILGGLPQYVRLLSQIGYGQRISVNGKTTDLDANRGKKNPFGETRLGLFASFMRGKLSPIPGIAVNLMDKKDAIGQPYHLWPNVPQELLPLPYTDVKEAYQVGGIDNALRVLIPSQFGVSVSSYDPNAKRKKK